MFDFTLLEIALIQISGTLIVAVMVVRKLWRMWGEVKWERKRNLQLWESHTRALAQIEDALRLTETREDMDKNPSRWRGRKILKHLKTARTELKTNPHRST